MSILAAGNDEQRYEEASDGESLPRNPTDGPLAMSMNSPSGHARSTDISLNELFRAFPDAIVAVDAGWTIQFANDAALKRAGDALIGAPFFSVSRRLGIVDSEEKLRQAFSRREPIEIKSVEIDFHGPVEVRAVPVQKELAIIVRDFAEPKGPRSEEIAAQALRLNETLNERVKERTAELEAANSELEGFTYSVSHDLRAPLRAIISTSRILLEDSKGCLNATARELLERQAAAAKKVGCLIDELLRLSRISRQEMATETLDLSLIAADVAQELRLDGRAERIAIEIESNLKATGDARLLRFVFVNLLENACKFTPGEGRIQIGKKDEAFFVRDEGIGFEMAYAHKLFLPFERLVNESEYPGTGIGLANVQRIVHRHGGRVWAESEPGRGSTFYFTLG